MVDINFIDEGSKRIIEVLNQDHLDRWLDKQGMQSLRRDRADGPEVDLFTQLASTKPSGDAMYYYPGPLKTQRQTRRGDDNRVLGVDGSPNASKRTRTWHGTDQMTPENPAKPPKPRISPFKRPTGDRLDLSDIEVLLKWLRSHMVCETKLVSQPHLLDQADELKYSLQDREEALKSGKDFLGTVFVSSSNKVMSRAKYPIPVCSAMSGIGKSRLLDEFVKLSNDPAEFPAIPQSRLALVLSYGNGHYVTPEEKSMGSVAGFSWRLLYAVFLEQNTTNNWEVFRPGLPENAAELKLSYALQVIAAAKVDCPLAALFVGIDEYQLVPRNHVDDAEDPLVPLLETLLGAMETAPSGVVILPMFVGTDWNKMSLAASASSASKRNAASVSTRRLSMSLLSPEATRRAVHGRGDRADELLTQEVFCRHLFFLGGVPRPCTQYAEECRRWYVENPNCCVGQAQKEYDRIFTSKFTEFFSGVYKKAPRENGEKEGFTLRELIWLVAHSVRGGTVGEEVKPFEKLSGSKRGHLSFRRLRDGSVCMLENGRLGLPYSFFHHLSRVDAIEYSDFRDAEKAFMEVLQYLGRYVDHNVFHPGNSPWQQWELFGACFSALRINALLITSSNKEVVVKLSRIFEGAKVNLSVDHNVKLRPMRVAQTDRQLESSSPAEIRLKNEAVDTNWVSTGVVVLNGDNGKGVDIFYTLELHDSPGKYLLVADQRNRVQGGLDVNKNVNKTVNRARFSPGNALKKAGIEHVVVSLFSMFTCCTLELPPDSIAVTFEQHADFHGALYLHPASSFCVRVNSDGVTALSGLFVKGGQRGADTIIKARESGAIRCFEDLKECLKGVEMTLWDDVESLCIFSQ